MDLYGHLYRCDVQMLTEGLDEKASTDKLTTNRRRRKNLLLFKRAVFLSMYVSVSLSISSEEDERSAGKSEQMMWKRDREARSKKKEGNIKRTRRKERRRRDTSPKTFYRKTKTETLPLSSSHIVNLFLLHRTG